MQSMIINEDFYELYDHYSEFEGKVGLFSSLQMKNYKNYLLNYLNSLINGLARASKKYGLYRLYFKDEFDFFEINEKCEQRLNKHKIEDHDKDHFPSLVSFKIGDLLRCKCSSK